MPTLNGGFFCYFRRKGGAVAVMRKVLTIAGSDSCAGAGLQADLKTFAAMKVYGLSVITAVTAQNISAVRGIHAVPPEFVWEQIKAVFEEIEIDAVKIGMTGSSAVIEVICEALAKYSVTNVVVDPVMAATSGDLLIDDTLERMLAAFRHRLIPAARVLTPNIPEAEKLTGRVIHSLDDMKAAALDLAGLGVNNVVVKGGHLTDQDLAVDILFDGQEFFEFPAQRIDTRNTHGTGCTFASAIAAGLAQGQSIYEAVGGAKKFVTTALKYSYSVGPYGGPVNHFGQLFRMLDASGGELD